MLPAPLPPAIHLLIMQPLIGPHPLIMHPLVSPPLIMHPLIRGRSAHVSLSPAPPRRLSTFALSPRQAEPPPLLLDGGSRWTPSGVSLSLLCVWLVNAVAADGCVSFVAAVIFACNGTVRAGQRADRADRRGHAGRFDVLSPLGGGCQSQPREG